MAFTKEYLPNMLWEEFMFFVSGGEHGAFIESISNMQGWEIFKIAEIRLHLSVVHVSVQDFTMRLSADSAQGSNFNQVFLSQAMLGINELLWIPDRPLIFQSDDQVVFSMGVASGTNVYGLAVYGWSVRK